MHRKQVSELERIVGLEAECSKLRNSLQAERSSLRKVVDEKVFVHASITACMRMEMEMSAARLSFGHTVSRGVAFLVSSCAALPAEGPTAREATPPSTSANLNTC